MFVSNQGAKMDNLEDMVDRHLIWYGYQKHMKDMYKDLGATDLEWPGQKNTPESNHKR